MYKLSSNEISANLRDRAEHVYDLCQEMHIENTIICDSQDTTLTLSAIKWLGHDLINISYTNWALLDAMGIGKVSRIKGTTNNGYVRELYRVAKQTVSDIVTVRYSLAKLDWIANPKLNEPTYAKSLISGVPLPETKELYASKTTALARFLIGQAENQLSQN